MNSSLVALTIFLVAAMFLSQAQAQGFGGAGSCCFDYTTGPVPQNLIVSYEHTNAGCRMPAVVFTTKKGIQFCADPSASWVQDRIANLS